MENFYIDLRSEDKHLPFHEEEDIHFFMKSPRLMPVNDLGEPLEPAFPEDEPVCGRLSSLSGPLTEKTKEDGDDFICSHELKEENSADVTISIYTEIDHFLLDRSVGSEKARHQHLSSSFNSNFGSKEMVSPPVSVAISEQSSMRDATSEFGGPEMTEVNTEIMDASRVPNPMDESTYRLPIISREGLRRAGRRAPDRIRKSNYQVEYLKRLYAKHGIKVDRKVRNRAIKETSLSWIQIYKWLFDKHMKETAKLSMSYNQYPLQIFRVIGPNGQEIGKPTPIFKIEKVARPGM